MQTIIILIASISGFSFSYFVGGFEFYKQICLFAGVFLITPSLFKFQVKDLAIISDYKVIVMKNIAFNFLILPIMAICIGLLFNDFGIAGALLLLSLFPGGGMVMNWIKNSKANVKLGFILLALNISLLSVSFVLFDLFSKNEMILSYYGVASSINSIDINPMGVMIALVIVPFILSRILLKFDNVINFMEKRKKIISNFAIFIIVFYLFSLESFSNIINIEFYTIIKSILATILFYFLTYVLAYAIYPKDADNNAGYWHGTTRFITITLAISTFAIGMYGNSFLIPIMVAYFIQIPLSSKFSQIRNSELSN